MDLLCVDYLIAEKVRWMFAGSMLHHYSFRPDNQGSGNRCRNKNSD